MGKSLFLALAISALAAAPAGSGGFDPGVPDGLLVLSVAGHDAKSRAVTREWAGVADPRTGVTRKRRLPGGTLCRGPVLAVGDSVIFGGFRGRRAVARALPLSLRGPVRTLGAAQSYAASAARDRVVLGRGLPRHSTLHAVTRAGRVITRRGALTLWDARAKRALRTVREGWFVAAGPSRVAWCRGRCRSLGIWTAGAVRTLTPPARMHPLGTVAAFSPDERHLAAPVIVDGKERAAVVDLRSGEWSLVPGGRLGGYHTLAWSPSGRWLYFTAGKERLGAWRVGTPAAVALPTRPGGTVISIATTPFAAFSAL